jgi:osmotically-inducible protein OsmY
MLSNPQGISVSVQPNNVVVLRGTVRDASEARLAEGMIRLTPGVRQVQNELRIAAP